MSHLRRVLVVSLVLLLSGCGLGRAVVGGPTAPEAGALVDATNDLSSLPSFDVPPADRAIARDLPEEADAESVCAADRDCPRGQRCLQGRCSEDVCLSSETACGPGSRCDMRCVPVRDLCAGVACAAGETCFGGRCARGCFPSPCAGVQCPAGQFCNEGTGACSPINPCPGRCDDGFACHLACIPRTPCDAVTCATTEVCSDGRCVPNPCAGVTCASGALCIDGRCVDTCACATPCDRSPRDRCLLGRCTCDRLCTPTSLCGSDDGCGGRCVGPCANPNATCDPVLFSCDCVPRCGSDRACGQDDGCGGRCTEGCRGGERCDPVMGRCICIQRCPPPESFAEVFCGVPVPNVCPDGPFCGTGTMCPAGQVCDPGLSRCVCTGDSCPPPSDAMVPGPDDAATVTCPVGLSACDGRCVDTRTDRDHCGDCTGHCPAVTSCVNGRCVCPEPLTLCGVRCVDTRTENGNCGRCGTLCAAGTACREGRCQCAEACVVDLNAVPCGTEVPSPCPGGASCGFGRACEEGQACDVRTRRCVCVPRCPAGVRCGVSDGCGGQCVGGCGAGETCTQDATDPRRFFCSAAGCAAGCRCDEVCAMNRCVQVTCASGDRPCPCQCCPFGQMCVGSACLPIPP